MKDLKKELVKANKLEDVLEALATLIKDKSGNYPVKCFMGENGKACFDLNAKQVRCEAKAFLNHLVCDKEFTMKTIHQQFLDEEISSCKGYENLWRYYYDLLSMLLHNYAVHESHRTENNVSMTRIRTIEIIENMLICAMNFDEREDTGDWNIPDGWYRKINDED